MSNTAREQLESSTESGDCAQCLLVICICGLFVTFAKALVMQSGRFVGHYVCHSVCTITAKVLISRLY